MLKQWKEPVETFLNLISDEQEIPCYENQQQNVQDAEFGERLTTDQKKQIQTVIKRFQAITRKEPGKTDQIHHVIHTENQHAVRQRPYQIPPALKEDVK